MVFFPRGGHHLPRCLPRPQHHTPRPLCQVSQDHWQRVWCEQHREWWRRSKRDLWHKDRRNQRLSHHKLEGPQTNASQHTGKTSRTNQLISQLESWTPQPYDKHTTENRNSSFLTQEAGIRTNHAEHPFAQNPSFPHLTLYQMDRWTEEERKGRRGSWPCPVPARATIHTLSSWRRDSLIWIRS